MNKSILSIIALVLIIIVVFSGCAPAHTPVPSTLPPLPTDTPVPTTVPPTYTPIPPSATPIPPTPTIIMASNEPIKIGDYTITIDNVRVGDVGWNPWGLSSNFGLVVYISELSGKLGEVSKLDVWFTDEQGNEFDRHVVEVGPDLSVKGAVNWDVWFSQPANGYLMHFPTGEVVDLTPLLNK